MSLIGCADGEREGLASETVAACGATWTGPRDLRAPRSGGVCGDDGAGECVQAADACAAGWHLCGASGDVTELAVADPSECAALDGGYVAAASHCMASSPCTYPTDGAWGCAAGTGIPCVQAICCGTGCDVTTGCPDGVWPGQTTAANDSQEGCGEQRAMTGVLCCRAP